MVEQGFGTPNSLKMLPQYYPQFKNEGKYYEKLFENDIYFGRGVVGIEPTIDPVQDIHWFCRPGGAPAPFTPQRKLGIR